MISREDVALALETAYGDSYSPEGRAQHERAAAAILALIQSASEVPVQRDERTEKLGEQLDAMAVAANTDHRIIARLEERVQNAEALAANLRRVDNERAIELMRVKRDLATMGNAVERLMQAVDGVLSQFSAEHLDAVSGTRYGTKLRESASDPALAAWRRT